MFWSGLCSPPLLHPCIRFIASSLRVTMSTSCSWSLVLASPVGVRPRLLPTRAASPGRAHALARVVDWERSHPYSVVPATHCCVLAAYNTIYNLQSGTRALRSNATSVIGSDMRFLVIGSVEYET